MNKEFVPYDIALAMKELGFTERCLTFYWTDAKIYKGFGKFRNGAVLGEERVTAPLYQQAFRWFREKLKESAIEPYDMVKNYSYNMKVSWEEAQDACLRKLIEEV